MKQAILFTSLLFALTPVVQAEELQLVTRVPYRQLLPIMNRVPPDQDFGNQEVEVWATIGGDCFGEQADVIDGFDDWVLKWGPDGFPLAVEIRCKPWRGNQSIVVVSQFTSRQRPPTHLWVFSANGDGSTLDRMLVDNGSVGRGLIDDHLLAFSMDRDRATAVLVLSEYPERSGSEGGSPEWASTDVYLLEDEPRRLSFDVVGAYRCGEAGSAKILLVTRDLHGGEPTWSLRSVTSSIDTVAFSRPIPKMSGSAKAERVQAGLEALRPVLTRVAEIRAAEDTAVLFESSVVKARLDDFEKSVRNTGAGSAGP